MNHINKEVLIKKYWGKKKLDKGNSFIYNSILNKGEVRI
jgi:hypothetical protein